MSLTPRLGKRGCFSKLSKQEELCQEEMEPALPDKVLVEVKDQDEEWVGVPAWEPAEIVSALSAVKSAPMQGEFPATP